MKEAASTVIIQPSKSELVLSLVGPLFGLNASAGPWR